MQSQRVSFIRAVAGILGITFAALGQTQPGEEWVWRNPLPQSHSLAGIAWGEGQFIAVGEGGTLVTSATGLSWRQRTSGVTTYLRSAAGNGSQFVAVGDSGTIISSADASSWALRDSGTTARLWGAAWGGDVFVTIGYNGTIRTSPDGVTWTPRTSGTFRELRKVVWGNGSFVAVGEAGVILTSTNGITWTTRTSGTAATLLGVAWNGSKFVAVGASGAIRVSDDGTNWTGATSGPSSNLFGVACSGGLFVVLGPNGYVYTSPDGLVWTLAPARVSPSTLYGIAWGNNQFVAVSSNGKMYCSESGTEWVSLLSGETAGLSGVTWNGSQFVAVGESSSILTSPDGVAWTKQAYWDTYTTLRNVCWGGNRFVVVGESLYGSAIGSSPDGVTWTRGGVAGLSYYQAIRCVTWADNQFVGVGAASSSGYNSPIITSSNGVNWVKRESGTIQALNAVAGNGELFVATGGGGTLLTSPDGVDWMVHDIWAIYNGTLNAVVWGQNHFVAVGGAILTSPDGTTWTKQASPSGMLTAVVWTGLQYVAVGSTGAIFTSPDAVTWTPRPSGCVKDLAGVTWNGSQFVAVGANGTILGSGSAGAVAGRILSPLRSGTLVAGDFLRFAGSTLDNPQTAYRWSFGDGRSSAIPSPGLISYPETGVFGVIYSVELGAEPVNTDNRSLTVISNTGDIADLEVTDVHVTGALAVGQPVQMTYTVRNAGQGPAGPSWRDAVYLSRDAFLDAGDLLLTSVTISQTLAAGETYQNVVNTTLPAAYAGACYLILAANEQWDVLELQRLNSERVTELTALVPLLEAGTNISVSYGAGRVEHYFRITASRENTFLRVPGHMEVFVRFGSLPTTGQYTYRVRGEEHILIPAATGDDWYIMVRGEMGQAGAYGLGYSVEDLSISASWPRKHPTGAALALTVTGAGFFQPLSVKLVSSEGQVYEAEQVEVDSFTQATAWFAAGAIPPGTYRVRIERNVFTAELAGALEVAPEGVGRLITNLIVPSGLGYHALATIYVEYANTGSAPIPAPLVTVSATQNGQPGAILTLEQSRVSSGFWTASMPAGFATAVQFIASGATPGVLQPGESCRKPVYYAGWLRPWRMSYPPVEWQVSVLEAGNTTSVNWDNLKNVMRPSYMSEEAWEILWSNFTALAGNTWGDYLTMLLRNTHYLHRHGVQVKDVESLLAFSMRLADGISPYGQLASANDAAVPAPGLPIFFGRSFLQPISRRHVTGDFGRGWVHSWQQSLSVKQDGSIVITGPAGTPRIFNPDIRYSRRYLGAPGDKGNLRSVDGGYRLAEANGGARFFRDGRLEYVEDTNGNRITCQYTGDQLTRLSHSAGGHLDLAYNSSGYITSVTDSHGRQTTYAYDGEYLASVQAHNGRITTYAYVASGAARHALAQIGHPNGNTRAYAYDERGRLTGTWRNSAEEAITITHGDGGHLVVTDALGNATSMFFNHWGKAIKTENPLGEIVHMRFDDLGRPISITDPDGSSASYAYDASGNLATMTDCLYNTTRFAHSGPFNRLARFTDALDRRTAYSYDDRGNLTSVVYPDGSTEAWTHDAQGQPATWLSRRGKLMTFEHDNEGRVTRKTRADGSTAVFRYNEHGHLAEAEDALGITAFAYDEHDYLSRVTYPGDRWLSFTYDEAGRRTASEDHTGYRVHYHYDASSRLSSISNASGNVVTYTYDELGRVARQTSGNGVYADHIYDPAGRLLSLVNHLPAGQVLSRFEYSYDRRGRRIAMRTHYGTWDYAYDNYGQLTRAVLTSTNSAIPTQDLTYEYDPLGNRVRTHVNGTEEKYQANKLNQYTTVGGRTYAYDLDGNMVEESGPDGTTIYTYNDENRLTGVTRGTNQWHYTYDVLGNRVAVDDNGAVTHFIYDPVGLGNLVAEYDTDGDVSSRYIHGLGLASRWNPTDGAGYYTFDPMGNTSELTGAAGELQNEHAYLPFGEAMLDVQLVPDAFKFMGQAGIMADPTGRHYVRWRQYDAAMGRFASVDPLGLGSGEINFYAYAANQPTAIFDPTGLQFECDIASFGLKTALGLGETVGGLLLLAGAVAAAPPTVGASTPVCALGLAITVGGAYDVVTGVAGMAGNGIALALDRNGLLSDESRGAIKRFWAPLNPSVPGLIAGALTTDWETGEFNGDVAAVTDAVAGVLTSVISPGRTWFTVGQSVAGGGADLGVQYGYCAPNKDPIPPPDVPTSISSTFTNPPVAPSDPNEKIGVAGLGALNFVRADRPLNYRISFENHALATAPAQVVTIRDPLSPHLDWSSLELGEIGFGNVIIQVPPGLQQYQAIVDYAYKDDDYDFLLEVHIEAWLENGTLCFNFSTIDPATGLPPPVDLGFLMPETSPATGRGRGYVTFLIRPKNGLSSGTAIRNVASIQFDFGEKIDTNQVDPHDPSKGTDPAKETLLTIDAHSPTSTVASLPAEAGPMIAVQWYGQDSGGAGIQSYDVYVVENGTNQTLWQSHATATNAWFRGEPGSSYGFFSIARDLLGYEEPIPSAPQAFTVVPTNAPVLASIPGVNIEVGDSLRWTNSVSGAPTGSWLFSLGTPAPSGLAINSTNGILHWAPSCANGSTTNIVTVWVVDTGNPVMLEAAQFTVIVGKCVSPTLGQVVLRAGHNGRVPINLISSVPITNLTMTLEAPPGRLTNLWIEPVEPGICTNYVAPLSNSLHLLSLSTCPGQWLVGTQHVAWLNFTAVTNQSSTFVGLHLDNISGCQPDGTPVRNFAPQSGRVAVVGEEPLLEGVAAPTNQFLLLQYAPPGSSIAVEWTTNLPTTEWQQWPAVLQTNLVQDGAILPAEGTSSFFRAVRQ